MPAREAIRASGSGFPPRGYLSPPGRKTRQGSQGGLLATLANARDARASSASIMPQISDSQAAVRRRFRETTTRLERFGADEDTAQLVFSIVQHLAPPSSVAIIQNGEDEHSDHASGDTNDARQKCL